MSHHLDAARIARSIDEKDATWCALDAEPKSAWPTRAAKQLEKLAYARPSCKVVLDFVARNNVELPPDPMGAPLRW